MNGFDEFKRECDSMSEEEFMAPFLEMGVEFIPIKVVSMKRSQTKQLNSRVLRQNFTFRISLQQDDVYRNQLIA